MEIIFTILLAILLLNGLLNTPSRKGSRGERKVSRKLSKLLKNSECQVFHDLILKTPDGTTQVDHIFLSPYGIFVIETKHLTGWIFGSENQRKWTQIVYKKKVSFQNPILQNYKHIKALESFLKIEQRHLINLVVFSGDAKFKTSMPDNVIRLNQLVKYIERYTYRRFNSDELNNLSALLSSAKSIDKITNESHLANLKSNKINPLCPKCGSNMILREARKGKNIGGKFWGCSKFPQCRVVKDV